MRYETIPTDKLKSFSIREIRPAIVDKIKERIGDSYNPARPMTVIPNDGMYLVAGGNHRLEAVMALGLQEVPCLVLPEGTDPYAVAIKDNEDEDTYAPMDLFDWLNIISGLRDEGLTQAQIGGRIGWSEGSIKKYAMLINSIVPKVLDLAKRHQTGRGTTEVPNGTFTFTEGWFRNSGLYDLNEYYQKELFAWATDHSFRASIVKQQAHKYKLWQSMEAQAEEGLYSEEHIEKVFALIRNGTFKNREQLHARIDAFNKEAKNRLICGDAAIELEKMDDNSIDIVITDPPYGVDYKSNRSLRDDAVTKSSVIGDADLREALDLYDQALEVLSTKTKQDAHYYIFTSWKVYSEFEATTKKHLDVKQMIVWDKENHGTGDLDSPWADGRFELIIFATKGKKAGNGRRDPIIACPRLYSTNCDMVHTTQKPVAMIKELLKASAIPRDVVCDPFMGSGSTIRAAIDHGDLSYIGIEIDAEVFEKAKAFISEG